MRKGTVLWVVGVLFSWLMVFLSWRFTNGQDVLENWTIFAVILTTWFLIVDSRRRSKLTLGNLEELR